MTYLQCRILFFTEFILFYGGLRSMSKAECDYFQSYNSLVLAGATELFSSINPRSLDTAFLLSNISSIFSLFSSWKSTSPYYWIHYRIGAMLKNDFRCGLPTILSLLVFFALSSTGRAEVGEDGRVMLKPVLGRDLGIHRRHVSNVKLQNQTSTLYHSGKGTSKSMCPFIRPKTFNPALTYFVY
jgi:hypothetical protein